MIIPFFRPAALILLLAQVVVSKPDMVRKYVPSSDDFPNPERGIVHFVTLDKKPYLEEMRAKGVTLVQANVSLAKFRTAPIDKALISQLEEGMKALRAAGLKVVIRFTYSGKVGESDAPKAWILKHVEQLKPLFQAHADVIALVQAGFIGAWGEWHASTNGLDTDEARKEILQALLAAVPASRMIQVRKPVYKRLLSGATPMTDAEIGASTPRARIAHHNDAYFANEGDLGTWSDKSLKEFLAQDGKFVAIGGETTDGQRRGEGEAFVAELGQMRWSFLHWRYPDDLLKKWEKEGHLAAIRKNLGYRFTLLEASWTAAVRPGGEMKLKLKLKNEGFAAPFNKRPAYVVLVKGDTRFAVALKKQDPRRWHPGADIAFTAKLGIPVNAPQGKYRLALWLPDDDPGLAPRPDYAIRFANEGVWDSATGLNVLAEDFKVDGNGVGGFNPKFKALVEVQ